MVQEPTVRALTAPLGDFGRVTIGASLKDVVCALVGRPGTRVVVVDAPSGCPVGLINLRGLFEALEPRFAKVSDWWVPLFWEGLLAERCAKAETIKVEEVVIPFRAAAVQADNPLMQVLHAMRQAKLDTLPVMDEERIVGLIEAGRIFEEVTRLVTARNGVEEHSGSRC